MSKLVVYLLGVATPFVAYAIGLVLAAVAGWLHRRIYRVQWLPDRRYQFVVRSDLGNAVAVTLPWWRRRALVIRFWPRPIGTSVHQEKQL